MNPIDQDYVKETCKLGQGAACCRFLVFGGGFECAKGTSLEPTINARVTSGAFTAAGDNCPGWSNHANSESDQAR